MGMWVATLVYLPYPLPNHWSGLVLPMHLGAPPSLGQWGQKGSSLGACTLPPILIDQKTGLGIRHLGPDLKRDRWSRWKEGRESQCFTPDNSCCIGTVYSIPNSTGQLRYGQPNPNP